MIDDMISVDTPPGPYELVDVYVGKFLARKAEDRYFVIRPAFVRDGLLWTVTGGISTSYYPIAWKKHKCDHPKCMCNLKTQE